MSEFQRAAFLRRVLGPPPSPALPVPNGDDAAVLLAAGPLVITTDMLVEGRDFDRAWAPWDLVGEKALEVNLSDVAAMGAAPTGYLLAVAAPSSLDEPAWVALADGLQRRARVHGIGCVGGDLSGTDGPVVITVTALGTLLGPEPPLRREGARPGDGIFVSGTLGGAAAGLAALQAGGARDAIAEDAVRRQRAPRARVELGQRLRGVASACIDLSDGLVQDLCHLLVASQVGAELGEALLPAHAAVARAPDPATRARWLLAGGEDFELLFTAPDEDAAIRAARAASTTITRVGRVVSHGGLQVGPLRLSAEDVAGLDGGEAPANPAASVLAGFQHPVR